MQRATWRRHVAAAIALTIAGTALEALFVGKVDAQETPVGFGAALVAAVVTVAALSAAGETYAPRLAWLALVPRVAWNVVRDTALVTVVLARALAGRPPDDRIVELPFAPGGDDPESAARRALAVAGISTSPNGIALDIDAERRVVRVHQLSVSRASAPLSEEWPL